MSRQLDLTKDYKVYKTKSGRQIQEPGHNLKKFQEYILRKIESIHFHQAAYGGILNRNLQGAVKCHQGASLIFKTDIKNFFGSTTRQHLVTALRFYPMTEEMKRFIRKYLKYCLYFNGHRKILPTGAPTSTLLSNIAARPIDIMATTFVNVIAKKQGVEVKYTRYIDDLTFSFPVYPKIDRAKFEHLVRKLVLHGGYYLNDKKTKWIYKKKDNMEVLGITQAQDGELGIARSKRRRLRKQLYELGKRQESLPESLFGQLMYLKTVNYKQYDKLLKVYQDALEKAAQC